LCVAGPTAPEDVANVSGRAYQFDGFGFGGCECRGALSFAICFLDHAYYHGGRGTPDPQIRFKRRKARSDERTSGSCYLERFSLVISREDYRRTFPGKLLQREDGMS
jgi:hypothetical protein